MDPTIGMTYTAVAQTLDTYYDGLYRGDTSVLRTVFHPDARYTTPSGDALVHMDLESYLPRVEARRSPAQLGEPYGYTLESIEFAGPAAASARMRSSMLGSHFVDFLSLIQVDGAWRIISKVFHVEAQEPAPSTGGA